MKELDASAVGCFNLVTKEMVFRPTSNMMAPDVIHALTHETGHAMRLERNLPLLEAFRYGIEIKLMLHKGVALSKYALEHIAVVLKQKIRQHIATKGDVPLRGRYKDVRPSMAPPEAIDDLEVWAEIVAFSLRGVFADESHPLENHLVNKYAGMFGIKTEELRKMVRELPGKSQFVPVEDWQRT